MIRKRALLAVLMAVMLLGTASVTSLADPEPLPRAQEGNLLQNPGFEGITCAPDSEPGWCKDNWTHDAFDGSTHGNIFTPQGWVTWWRKGGDYAQPEVKVIPNVPPFTGELPRIHSGNYALLYFNVWRLQDGGIYQVVRGLEPGSTVQFSAFAHGWACGDSNAPMGYSCGDPWSQTFQVGIEPNGGTDPFSPSIVWSAEQTAPDTYRSIGAATAQVGPAGSVTVFLRARGKWKVDHLDAYWDDASLVLTAGGTPAEPTQAPAPAAPDGPPPTPRPKPTPRPDGAIVHVVEYGDTLGGIALTYDTTVDELHRLNAGSIGDNNMIVVGQELVVSAPTQPVAADPTPLPEQPTPAPEAVPDGNTICVVAYHDRDGNTFRAADTEELLPNAEFLLADASGVLSRYTSDGLHEPYCFSGLAPGTYRVILNSPAGYEPSGPAEWPAALTEGARLELQFGNVRTDGAGEPAGGEGSESEPAGEGDSGNSGGSPVSDILSTIAKVSGILVLVLAAGVAVLFVFTRRRY